MKKRIFLDEDIDVSLAKAFSARSHVYTGKDLGVLGRDDPTVINAATQKGCLIVTANKDFIDYYRNDPRRRQRNTFFYGLIFLSAQGGFEQKRQLQIALRQIPWKGNRAHDGLVIVRRDGNVCCELLCHEDCARQFEAIEIQRRMQRGIGPSRYAPISSQRKSA